MKKIYSLFASMVLLASASLTAQTYHNVTVTNFTFNPQQLEISVGDTVLWTNAEGEHSVVGNMIDFPDNPESFGNEIGPPGWNYEFVFTIPGTYSYKCGAHPSMTGAVIVSEGTVGISEIENNTYFAIFPNPVVDQLSWKWNDNNPLSDASITIFDAQGKQVDHFSMNGMTTYDVSSFSEGLYTFVLMQRNEKIQTGKILINR